METRVAIIGIIVEKKESAESVNNLLHEYNEYIVGRMGIPYKAKDIGIISIAIDASQDIINSLAGKVGRIEGVSAKAVYSAK